MLQPGDVPALQRRVATFLNSSIGQLYLDAQTSFLHGYTRRQFHLFLDEAVRFGKPYYCVEASCCYLDTMHAEVRDWILSQQGVPAAGFCCLARPLLLPGAPPAGYEYPGIDLAALFWSFDDGSADAAAGRNSAPAIFVGFLPSAPTHPAQPGTPLLAFAWPLGAPYSVAMLAFDCWRPEEPAPLYDRLQQTIASFFFGLATGTLKQQRLVVDPAEHGSQHIVHSIVTR